MSTTAVVTPYEPMIETEITELARREEKALSEYRAAARKQRISCPKARIDELCRGSRVIAKNSLTLKTGSLAMVRQAAEAVGYTQRLVDSRQVELVNQSGGIVRIALTKAGKVALSSSKADLEALRIITREYTASQVFKHLKSQNMQVAAYRSDSGEITIEARSGSGPMTIVTDIRKDGVAIVDVAGIKGDGCRKIVADIASSFDGDQIDTERKNEYFIREDERERAHV